MILRMSIQQSDTFFERTMLPLYLYLLIRLEIKKKYEKKIFKTATTDESTPAKLSHAVQMSVLVLSFLLLFYFASCS